jgi:hypothetical protein
MSRSIELTDEDYANLERAAEMERVTPAEWVSRRIPRWREPLTCADGTPARTMADVLAGQIGLFSSGNGPRPATMAERLAGRTGLFGGSNGLPSSDDVAQSFAEHLEAKQREGRL